MRSVLALLSLMDLSIPLFRLALDNLGSGGYEASLFRLRVRVSAAECAFGRTKCTPGARALRESCMRTLIVSGVLLAFVGVFMTNPKHTKWMADQCLHHACSTAS